MIVKEDMLGQAMKICPIIFDFTIMANNNSIYNTPPVFQYVFLIKILTIKKSIMLFDKKSKFILFDLSKFLFRLKYLFYKHIIFVKYFY